MLIKPRGNDTNIKKITHRELQRVHESGPLRDPVCCSGCPDYDPAQGCHRDCAFAPCRLSSEAEKYPLEGLIAPLVFELKKLGVFLPCWSCEGHNDANGSLWKIPRVWFYSDSVIHLRALDNGVHNLFSDHRISAPSGLSLPYSHPENPDTTFSLEPKLHKNTAELSELQNDLKIISENLAGVFYQSCDQLRQQAC